MSSAKRNRDAPHRRMEAASTARVPRDGNGCVPCETSLGPLLTVAQLATELGISKRLVYRLVEQGQLPHLRMGRRIRFVPEVVAAFLKERAEAGACSEERPRGRPLNLLRTSRSANVTGTASTDIPPARWETPARRRDASTQVTDGNTRTRGPGTVVEIRSKGAAAAPDAMHTAGREEEE